MKAIAAAVGNSEPERPPRGGGELSTAADREPSVRDYPEDIIDS